MSSDSKIAVETYKNRFGTYRELASRLKNLLEDLLKAEGIKIHFIESRAKSPESLSEKISRPGKSYGNPLAEVPDLVGVRIVLYYQDEIAKVGRVIKREFTIVEEEGTHQPDRYSPEEFGYLSMHYVVLLHFSRSRLPEWRQFKDLRAEIQVRTLLQHSWAAVSHALQYKSEGDVPLTLRRRLYRLAGLFELADEEFVGIRDVRDKIEKKSIEAVQIFVGIGDVRDNNIVKKSIEVVQDNEKSVRIDAPVLLEFMKTSPALKKIVRQMEKIGYAFASSRLSVGQVVEECERIGVRTLSDLEVVLAKDYGDYLQRIFTGGWMMDESFVLYLLLIASHPDAFNQEHLKSKGWSADIAKRVLTGIKKQNHA